MATRPKPEDFTPYQLHSGRVSEIGIEKIADSTDKTEQLLTEQWVTINEFSDAKLKQYFEFAKENAKRIADASLASGKETDPEDDPTKPRGGKPVRREGESVLASESGDVNNSLRKGKTPVNDITDGVREMPLQERMAEMKKRINELRGIESRAGKDASKEEYASAVRSVGKDLRSFITGTMSKEMAKEMGKQELNSVLKQLDEAKNSTSLSTAIDEIEQAATRIEHRNSGLVITFFARCVRY